MDSDKTENKDGEMQRSDESSGKVAAAAAAAGTVSRPTETSRLVSGDEEKSGDGLWSLPKRQICILFALMLVELSAVLGLSVMAPFFPKEAAGKGMNMKTTGWVFGIYALVCFLMSPIFGKMLPFIGCRWMIAVGQFLSGTSLILFGLLEYIDDYTLFTSFCFVFRIMAAVGSSASSTAGFAVVSLFFPRHVSTVYGILEGAVGIGWMIGPTIGGFLHWLYGFLLPFVVLGSIILVMVPVYVKLIPDAREEREEGEEKADVPLLRQLQLLLHPAIIVTCQAVVLVPATWSSLEPTLEPHLRQFQLNSLAIGGIFFALSAAYAVSCLVTGKITDSLPKETGFLLMAIGFLLSSCDLLFLGPSPILTFLHRRNILWLNIVSAMILSAFGSLCIVPSYQRIIACVRSQTELDLSTHGMIAGLFNGCYSLGSFLGSSAGGWLFDTIGFDWTMTVEAGFCAFTGCALLVVWILEVRRR